MVDPHRLRALLGRLNERCARLEAYGVIPTEQYLASEGMRSPTDYADAFRVLAAAGILEADLATRLENMARFRDLLVHVYAEVDDARVHEFIRADLEDLTRFAGAVLEAYPTLDV